MAEKEKSSSRTPKRWFKVDNAGKIFPGQRTETWSNVFRVSVVLKEKIVPEILEQALEDVLPRFPCFDVKIKKGFFWYYLQENEYAAPPVMLDVNNPCHRIKWNENNHFLFKVYYYDRRISVDFFHVLTDGYGGSLFLCTLAARYLTLCGHTISVGGNVLDINEPATEDEINDAFVKFANSKAKLKKFNKFVYHAKGTKLPNHRVNITTGFMPVDALKKKAAEYNATITEFLGALLLYIHYQKQNRECYKKKDVSVQIPVNLRRTFPTNTFRNFSLCYSVRIDPNMGEYTFEEVVKQVSLYLRYINNEKQLNAMISNNLKLESNPINRILPLFIKDAAIGLSFLLTGEQTTSVLLTNLGVVKLPKDMEPFVDKFIFMAGPGKLNGARCGASSLGNCLALTFANIYAESDIEREFFTSLVKMGIHVKVESNR